MAKPKAPDDQADATQLLERRVDVMMDLNLPPEPVMMPGAPVLGKAKTAPLPPASEPPAPTVVPGSLSAPPQSVAPPGDFEVRPVNLDTPQSNAAIADIIAQEADEVLAAEDAGIADAAAATPEPKAVKRRGHPIFWFLILLLVIVAVVSTVMLVNPNLQLPFGA